MYDLYSLDGTALNQSAFVYVKDIKTKYPSYTDDQVLDLAINLAQEIGDSAIIVWDGEPIYFSGSITHVCSGFSGIDFNGSEIYMPNYDGSVIISIEPDSSTTVSAEYTDFEKSLVTNQNLKGKVFTINGPNGYSLGTRQGYSDACYWRPTVKTSPDGHFETGELWLLPTSGTVECTNVHDYPANRFVVKNGIITTYNSANMSTFIRCSRSNTKICNFTLKGRSQISTYHDGVFVICYCFDTEVSHISGVNPIQNSLTSGYFLMLVSPTNVYVHDTFVGDSISWGSVGANYMANTVFERCYLNRWDCHYAQTGYHTIKNCVLNEVQYGIGDGKIIIDNCIIQNNKQSNSEIVLVSLRPDIVGVYEGDITVKDSLFYIGNQSPSLVNIWGDYCLYQKPSNSDIDSSPHAKRILDNCKIYGGCKNLLLVGAYSSSDKSMYENIEVVVKNMYIETSNAIVDAKSSAQDTLFSLLIENCVISTQCYITKLITDIVARLSGCNFGTYSARFVRNQSSIIVSDTMFGSVIVDNASSRLNISGSVFSDTQDVTKFTNYSLYGNVSKSGTSGNAGLNRVAN